MSRLLPCLLLPFLAALAEAEETEFARSLFCYYTPPAPQLNIPLSARLKALDIPPRCTDIVYGFAGISSRHRLVSPSSDDLPTFTRPGILAELASLKRLRPGTRIHLAVKPDPLVRHHASPRADLARLRPSYAFLANPYTRTAFAVSLQNFLLSHGLDGAVLHFPSADRRKFQYIQLLQDLYGMFHREEVGKAVRKGLPGLPFRELSLSVFVGAKHLSRCRAFLPDVNQNVDHLLLATWINGREMMPHTTHYLNPLGSSALVASQDTISDAVHFAVASGVEPRKLIVGLSLWARSYTIKDAHRQRVGLPAEGWGKEASLSKRPGHLVYPEVCHLLRSDSAATHYDLNTHSSFGVNAKERLWITFNGRESLKEKTAWVRDSGLGGVGLLSLDADDFHDTCGEGQFPLLSAVYDILPLARINRPAVDDPAAIPAPTVPILRVNNDGSDSEDESLEIPEVENNGSADRDEMEPQTSVDTSSTDTSDADDSQDKDNEEEEVESEEEEELSSPTPSVVVEGLLSEVIRNTERAAEARAVEEEAEASSEVVDPSLVEEAFQVEEEQRQEKADERLIQSLVAEADHRPSASPPTERHLSPAQLLAIVQRNTAKANPDLGQRPVEVAPAVVTEETDEAEEQSQTSPTSTPVEEENLSKETTDGSEEEEAETKEETAGLDTSAAEEAGETEEDGEEEAKEDSLSLPGDGPGEMKQKRDCVRLCHYRPALDRSAFDFSDLRSAWCSHIIFAFAVPKRDGSLHLAPQMSLAHSLFQKWKPKDGGPKPSLLFAVSGTVGIAASAVRRERLLATMDILLNLSQADGIDLHWSEALQSPSDAEGFAILVRDLRRQMLVQGTKPLQLIVSVYPRTAFAGHYLPEIKDSVDYINLIGHDFHRATDVHSGHHAPLHIPDSAGPEVDRRMSLHGLAKYFAAAGVPRAKLVAGLTSEAQSQSLLFVPEEPRIGLPSNGPGNELNRTDTAGIAAYDEMMELLAKKETKLRYPANWGVPIASLGDQYYSFDDLSSVWLKTLWANGNQLGGISVWGLEMNNPWGLGGSDSSAHPRFPFPAKAHQIHACLYCAPNPPAWNVNCTGIFSST